MKLKAYAILVMPLILPLCVVLTATTLTALDVYILLSVQLFFTSYVIVGLLRKD